MAFWFFGREKEDKIKKLEVNLKHSFLNIKEDFSLINKMVNKFIQKHDHHDERLNKIEAELIALREMLENTPSLDDARSIVHERSIAFNRSNQSFMNVQSLKNTITPAQKKVIHVLSLADIPLEYEDLAKELKLNIITVRRHLNDLKKMGFDVKEKINVGNGRKVFFIEKAIKKEIMRKKRI